TLAPRRRSTQSEAEILGPCEKTTTKRKQQTALSRHDNTQVELVNQQTELNRRVTELTEAVRFSFQASDDTPPFWSELYLSFSSPGPPLPERFSGNPRKLKGFLFQCQLLLGFHTSSFPNDKDKIAFVVSFLCGEALEWAESRFPLETRKNCTYQNFILEFEKAFSRVTKCSVSGELLNMKQGNRSVTEFSIEFQVRAAVSGWNESALKSAYLMALNNSIRKELSFYVEPATLEDLIELAIGLDLASQTSFSSSPRRVSLSSHILDHHLTPSVKGLKIGPPISR
uniref:Ty3 transposon capsid-like protein domain-containing protein n=1 Tax=Cyprinodon variegatus TaxID=28743 RepID=A0A3Q2D431_CYPVA